jgi:hypothetical protein
MVMFLHSRRTDKFAHSAADFRHSPRSTLRSPAEAT